MFVQGDTRSWTKDLSICSRMLYHWAISPLREGEMEFFFFETTITWQNTRRHILSPWIRYLYWGLEYKIFEFDYDIKWISLNVNYASNSPAGNLGFSGRLQAFRNCSREMRNKTQVLIFSRAFSSGFDSLFFLLFSFLSSKWMIIRLIVFLYLWFTARFSLSSPAYAIWLLWWNPSFE